MDKLKDTLEDLSITGDEIKKLSDAFKSEEFRKLFREYAEELQDPENRRKYEEELTAMENERGMDVEFINPTPGHSIKCIQNGNKKIFVNICCSDKIKPAEITPSTKKDKKGIQWSIPHSFSPPREDFDKKNDACLVYDVVFNPETYQMGVNDTKFRQMLHDTALQGIENSFQVKIDMNNIRILKLKMKGQPTATVIRKKRTDFEERQKELQMLTDEPLKFPYPDEATETSKVTYDIQKPIKTGTEYTRPLYTIKYSDEFDIANYVGEEVQHHSRPKKLIVEIKLPLVASAKSVDLDIDNIHFTLTTEKPFKYKLEMKFTYPILSDKGTAKFDKATRTLRLDLPVEQLAEITINTLNGSLCEDLAEPPKAALIDESIPLIENQENLVSVCDEPCMNEKFETEVFIKSDEIERKKPNVILRYRMTDFYAFIVCDIKNVNPDDIKFSHSSVFDICQNVTINFSTCGQGGWLTCYSLPLVLRLSGPETIVEHWVTCRVTKENFTVKLPIKIGSEQVLSVSYQDQIISLEKKDEYVNWKNLCNIVNCGDQGNVDDNSFNVAYGIVDENVLKIVCVSADQEINIQKEFPQKIEPIMPDGDTYCEEVLQMIEHHNVPEEIKNEEVVEIKDNPSVKEIDNVDVYCENGEESMVSECTPIIEPDKGEELQQMEGIVPSDYFEERRDGHHRTYCPVNLDEKLLFDLE